jgi:hypothetical protein
MHRGGKQRIVERQRRTDVIVASPIRQLLKATGALVAGGFYIARLRSIKHLSAASAAFAAAVALLAYTPAPAGAAVCGSPVPYPGDAAAAGSIANWMANGAAALNLPGELPVMAALVESNLKNLNYGDADSLGYFQMRESIWNNGAYAGYPTNPDLQMKWFTDQAAKVRLKRIAASQPDPASDAALFGEWIADIELPAAQYRGRYQLRLADARALIAQTCESLPQGGGGGGDIAPPKYSLRTAKRQHPLRTRSVTTQVFCPLEACNVGASAVITLAGRRHAIKVLTETSMLAPARRKTIKIALSKGVRKAIRESIDNGRAYARLRLRIADAGNVATFKVVKIRLLR